MNNTFEEILLSKEKQYLWYCNLGVENRWGNKAQSILSDYRLRNVEEVSILLARNQDVVLCRESPDENYLSYFRTLKFDVPTFFALNDNSSNSLLESVELNKSRLVNEFKNKKNVVIPYAYDEYIDEIIEESSLQWLYKFPYAVRFNDKIKINRIMKENGILCPDSFECHGYEEIEDKCKMLFSMSNTNGVVLKQPFGASGNGNYLLTDLKNMRSVMRVFAKSKKDLLIERYCDRAENFSYQLYLAENGIIDIFFVSKQSIQSMVYKGSEFGKGVFVDTFENTIREAALEVARVLYGYGVRGIVGIDGIYTEGKIYPAIDVNVRCTMSTYLSRFSTTIGKDRYCGSVINDIKMHRCLKYDEILIRLEQEKLLYALETGNGVLIYISGTLPRHKSELLNSYVGRIYALIVADDKKTYMLLSEKYNKFVRELGRDDFK